ncbi:MAG: hypothetical protein F8N39_15315, partial [Clostridiaceae bacterium]|nr:hypothetical protein [Clostridiaceae bacterium]
MDFFEKLQESIYDIVGYLIPGLIIVIVLMPSFALYRDNGTLVFPVQALYNKSNLSSIKFLEDMNFSTSKGVFILFIAYLAGHLVKYLANLYYEVVKS